MATGGVEGILRVWKVTPMFSPSHTMILESVGGRPYKEFKGWHERDIFEINWCPKGDDNNNLLTAGFDHKVIIWNLNAGTPIQELSHSDIVSSAVF